MLWLWVDILVFKCFFIVISASLATNCSTVTCPMLSINGGHLWYIENTDIAFCLGESRVVPSRWGSGPLGKGPLTGRW